MYSKNSKKIEDNSCNRKECFSHSFGKCKALHDTNFGRRKCPFFKTKKQIEEEEKRTQERKEQENEV